LDEVGAQEEAVLGAEQVADPAQEAGPLMGPEVADRAAEERDDARSLDRHALEVELEVADEAVDADPLVLRGDRVGGVAGGLLIDGDRAVGVEAAGLPHRIEQASGLAGRSRPELDQARRPVRGLADPPGLGLEDLALAARGVVLVELGDPLEELRAALVVEVARRELLERTGEARPDVRGHAGGGPARGQVHVDGPPIGRRGVDDLHTSSFAHRMPAKICRRIGRSQLRKLVRMTSRRVAQAPPRRTLCSSPKKTSEYSGYGKARKPGYAVKSELVHSQTSPSIWTAPLSEAPSP